MVTLTRTQDSKFLLIIHVFDSNGYTKEHHYYSNDYKSLVEYVHTYDESDYTKYSIHLVNDTDELLNEVPEHIRNSIQ
jgi:hypothetical protein